jgi:hypothetical protein
VSSWSATVRYRAARGADPLPLLRERLEAAWPPGASAAGVRMPLALRVARLGS